MISQETREFVDDIDDEAVKNELSIALNMLEMIDAGTKGSEDDRKFAEAFDNAISGLYGANARQKESINRLVDERRQLLKMNANLQTQLTAANQWSGHRAPG
jgi:uncharacterized protein YpuA (DUF1002 family)